MQLKKLFFVSLLILSLTARSSAQDCKMFYPDKQGAVREMTHYDKKGKFTGKTVQEVLSLDDAGSKISIDVRTTIYDEDNEQVEDMEMEVVCENGIFRIDMTDYLSEMLQEYQEMEVELKGDNLMFPSGLAVGDELEDASMNIKVSTGGMQIMNMDVNIVNRSVEARESITTDAGTFECYKISYDTESKTKIINVLTHSTEWIAEGVGLVKVENYNKKGKLNSYMVLTDLQD